MTPRTIRRCAVGLSTSALLACGDSSGPTEGFSVSGTIQNNTQSPVPANARLLVVWVVSSGSPDYTYVFGEGTIDRDAGTFEVRITDPPPTAALNDARLGVGVIVLTTNATVSTGDDMDAVPQADFVGAAGRHGVIYIAGDPADAAQSRAWALDFTHGYGVGVGVSVPGDFDKFAPTNASGVVLVVDDWENIEFVNWT